MNETQHDTSGSQAPARRIVITQQGDTRLLDIPFLRAAIDLIGSGAWSEGLTVAVAGFDAQVVTIEQAHIDLSPMTRAAMDGLCDVVAMTGRTYGVSLRVTHPAQDAVYAEMGRDLGLQ